MTNKKMRLPKDGARGPEQDGVKSPYNDGRDGLIDNNDVEGHGLPTTAPPSFGTKGPGHGGENIPAPDDEGPEGVVKS